MDTHPRGADTPEADSSHGPRHFHRVCPFRHDDEVRLNTSAVISTVSLVLLVLGAAPSAAAPRAVEATVVWQRASRAYVAFPDSGALETGLTITFVDRDAPVAWGEVIEIVKGELAVVRLTWGSLGEIKRLDRVAVLAESRPPRAPTLLRVGAPSPRRANLVVDCARLTVTPPNGAFTTWTAANGSHGFVRVTAEAGDRWPDTLVVRLFDDATDEEIALARGDLDVAIFWPGEMSPHLRDRAGGRDALRGTRARGMIAGAWSGLAAGSPPPSLAGVEVLAALNDQLFGGDLAPLYSARAAGSDTLAARDAAPAPRVVAGATLPGQRTLQRFLDRYGARPGAKPGSRPAVTLTLSYADAAVPGAPDDARVPLFAVRCSVVSNPAMRAYVTALGPDALVGLLACEPAAAAR